MKQVRLNPSQATELMKLVATPEPKNIVLEPGEYVVGPICPNSSITLTGKDPATTVLRSVGDRELMVIGEGAGVTNLRGLTFDSGRSDGGGAIMMTNEAHAMIEGCVFSNNSASAAGGAIFAELRSHLELSRCIFRDNESEQGGAIALMSKAQVRIDRCLFFDNEGVLGGAVYVGDEANVDIISSSFFNNRSTHPKGGGAIFVTGMRRRGPTVGVHNALVVGTAPLVNNADRPGDVRVDHCLLPPLALAEAAMTDAGDNLQVQADLVDVGGGLWAIRTGASGSGGADVQAITKNALDVLGRPLVVDGKADPGALASPTTAANVANYTSIVG
jgi:predicted outer membrane repeat protein